MNAEQIGMFDGEKPYKINKPIRLIELFAGIGSQAKALQNIGADFEHYRICEFDKYAVKSYNAVHGTQFETSDITKINASDLGITDTDKYEYIMTYSFPCQDLSITGKQSGMAKGSGTRSGLLWEVERLLDECSDLPQVLLMENVPDVIGTKNISHFANWIKKLETLGYHNYWKLLNAKDYGIPQNRNRCFMVSVLGDYYYNFPQGFPLELRLKDMLEEKVDEKYYLRAEQLQNIKFNDVSGIEEKVHIKEIGKLKPHRHSSTANSVLDDTGICPTLDTMGGGNREPKVFEPRIFDMYNHTEIKTGICGTLTAHGNTSSTHCGTFGIIEPQIIDDIYNNREPIAYDEQNGYLRKDGTAGALTTDGSSPKHNNRVVENYRIRKLTPKECWRLMGFDDTDFEKAKASGVSNSQLYKQAGNSIVVKVLEVIFKQMQE